MAGSSRNVQKSIEVSERRIECEEAGKEMRAGLAKRCETKIGSSAFLRYEQSRRLYSLLLGTVTVLGYKEVGR